MGFWDWVFPRECVVCGRESNFVCEGCQVGMWEAEQICPGCKRLSEGGIKHAYCREKSSLEGLRCEWAYDGVIPELVRGVKFKYLTAYLDVLVPEEIEVWGKGKILVPIPLHKKREKERGFNQAEEICKRLSQSQKLPIVNLLKRQIYTLPQTLKNREERLQSLKGAFVINEGMLVEKVILVDDVWTTGATMEAAAKALKAGGVKEVWGWVMAR